jgi:hypothetical protein
MMIGAAGELHVTPWDPRLLLGAKISGTRIPGALSYRLNGCYDRPSRFAEVAYT